MRISDIAILSFFAFPMAAHACGLGVPITGGYCQYYATTSGTLTLPSDWNPANNTVECIGEGGNGVKGSTAATDGAGGGGGAYALIHTFPDIAGTVEGFTIGPGGTATPTTFKNNTTLVCDYGRSGVTTTGGAGGAISNNYPVNTGYSGGAGGGR